jgi:hypothetical protein
MVVRQHLSVATDVSVAFERGAGHTRPRLSVRQTRAREVSSASVAEEVDHWISGARTHGTCRSNGCYCAAFVGLATDTTVQRMSPPKIVQ